MYYWDEGTYMRMVEAEYQPVGGWLVVHFASGECVRLKAARLVPSDERVPDWTHLEIEEGWHIRVPTQGAPLEIPGFTVRALTDPVFAAHLARQAAASAQQVGMRLRQLRVRRELSITDVAARVGMAQQHLSRLERGQHSVSFETLRKILAAMGYSLQDIVPPAAVPSDDRLPLRD